MNTEQNTIASDANAAIISKVLPKIEALQAALLAQAPGVRNHLQDINEDLRQYPDLVHLLSDEQLAPIYSALREHTNVEISTRAAKKKSPAASAQAKIDLANLL